MALRIYIEAKPTGIAARATARRTFRIVVQPTTDASNRALCDAASLSGVMESTALGFFCVREGSRHNRPGRSARQNRAI